MCSLDLQSLLTVSHNLFVFHEQTDLSFIGALFSYSCSAYCTLSRGFYYHINFSFSRARKQLYSLVKTLNWEGNKTKLLPQVFSIKITDFKNHINLSVILLPGGWNGAPGLCLLFVVCFLGIDPHLPLSPKCLSED